MLTDGKVIKELAKKDKSLFDKIKSWIDNLLRKLEKEYNRYSPETKEGQMLLEMKETFKEAQRLFTDALVDASDNFAMPNADFGVLNSLREIVGEDGTNYGVGVYLDSQELADKTTKNSVQEMARGKTNIDNLDSKLDNVSRANKQGDFINEYYNALDNSEWRVFYNELVKQGYIANTQIGTIAAIVVGNKLVIAERKYTAKDKHDYIVIDAYKLFSQDGDNYTLSLLQDALNKGDIDYDTQRIFSFVDRLNRSYGTNELLTAYNRSNSRYDITVNNTKQGNGSSEIHGVSQEGTAGERVSLRDKPSIQENNELLKKSDRDTLESRHRELQNEYNSLNKEIEEIKNSEKYKYFVDALATLESGEELDNAIKEYGR